jgi:hypothetical protein
MSSCVAYPPALLKNCKFSIRVKLELHLPLIHFSKLLVPAVIGYVDGTRFTLSVEPKFTFEILSVTVSLGPFDSDHAKTAVISVYLLFFWGVFLTVSSGTTTNPLYAHPRLPYL